MSPIISVENLGKSYLVGHQSANTERYTALRDVLGRSVKSFGRKAWDMARGRQMIQGDEVEEFWALKNVSFEVNEGEVVGIIGRNGAGKSTLLKILSRITEPTKGKVTLRGRVASLLEVGTGFHPELTGRENIFLNGAILGMTRAEIKKKFDEIVDFAGVEKFLDTPVKRYSSGMYVRLAFAVAAHLEPEILVVDEVLAVGDAEFQKKCLGKMHDIATEGRTVIFVSHNMVVMESLCKRIVFLKKGTVQCDGESNQVVNEYLSAPTLLNPEHTSFTKQKSTFLKNISTYVSHNNGPPNQVIAGKECRIVLAYEISDTSYLNQEVSVSFMLFGEGRKIANLWTDYFAPAQRVKLKQSGEITCVIERWPFRNFVVRLDVYINSVSGVDCWIEESTIFQSQDGDFYGSGSITASDQGFLFLQHHWTHHAGK